MDYRYLHLESRGPVALITLDNPATGNAMDEDLGPELVWALEEAAANRQWRAVVLTGAGKVFTGGGNVVNAHRYLLDHPGQGAGPVFDGYTKWVSRGLWAMTGMPKPLITAVAGSTSGAGLAWMLASELVVVSDQAKILPGFVAIGLVPAAGATWHLPRLAGLVRAAGLLMQNQPLSPRRCLELGLANRVAPTDRVLPLALELATSLAQGPVQAMAASKALLRRALGQGFLGHIEDERRAVMAAADAPDFTQRVERFVRRG